MRGELESQIMELLWQSPRPLTGPEIVSELPPPTPELSTVLTVANRLVKKALLHRMRGAGMFEYAPVAPKSIHLASEMVGTLNAAMDHREALLQFAGRLNDEDAEILKRILNGRS